ncbi:hypothetical protein [Campylobacter devanensis]
MCQEWGIMLIEDAA